MEQRHWTLRPPRNTLTAEAIDFIKEQMRVCREQHGHCQQVGKPRPTRLLRLVRSRDFESHQEIYVYLDEDTAPSDYITLSHCWGQLQPIRLTKSTETQLRAGLSSQHLPKTFRDAVYVCHELGVGYIWIDSLCIFQDDLRDWEHESNAMFSVYANALCNIAASESSDSSVGLFFERDPLVHMPFRVKDDSGAQDDWVFPPDWTPIVVSEGPLNKRAWVFQERLLSRRTIHFTIAGIYWECIAEQVGDRPSTPLYDDGSPEMQIVWRVKAWLNLARNYRDTGLDPDELKHMMQGQWLRILPMYTECDITKDTDRLIALSGISRWGFETLGIEMRYGLWNHKMLRELLWEVSNNSKRIDPQTLPVWRAPSWSWANANFRVVADQYWLDHPDCEGETLHEIAETQCFDWQPASSGKMDHVALTLRGKLLYGRVRMVDFDYWEPSRTTILSAGAEIDVNSRSFVFDRLPEFPYEEELTFIALMECHCRVGRSYSGLVPATPVPVPRPTLAALMLRQLPTTPITYSRMGILRLEGPVGEGSLEEECACEWYHRHETSDVQDIVIV